MKNSFLKMKKLISVAIITLVIVLISIVCVVAVNHKSDKVKGNQETSKIIVGNASTMSGDNKYSKVLSAMASLKCVEQTIFETKINYMPRYATHYFNIDNIPIAVAKINDRNNHIDTEDSFFHISSAEEYKEFTKLTHELATEIYLIELKTQFNTVPYKQFMSKKYIKYPFCISEFKIARTFVKYNDNIYTPCLPLANESIQSLEYIDMGRASSKSLAMNLGHVQMKVVLDNDITVELHADEVRDEQENIQYFAGIFDGQGHTISFTGSDRYYAEEADGMSGFHEAYSPFCSYLAGTIKNVRLDYFGTTASRDGLLIDAGITSDSWVGGIVGCNKGEVFSCVVSNPRVGSNRWIVNAFYGALAGWNEGIIHDCLVDGTYDVYAQKSNGVVGEPDGIEVYWGAAHNVNDDGTKVIRCLFKATVVENKISSTDRDLIKSPADVGKTAVTTNGKEQQSYDYYGHEDTGTCYDIVYGISATSTNFQYIGTSNVGGASPDNTYWYNSSYYNGGIPHLRAFIKWQTLKIISSDSDIGTVSLDEIEIPEVTATETYGIHDQEGKTTYTVLDRVVTLSIKQEGYRVAEWKVNYARTELIVYFMFDTITLHIIEPNGYDYIYSEPISVGWGGAGYFVRKGADLTIDIENGKEMNGGYCCTAIILSFSIYKKQDKYWVVDKKMEVTITPKKNTDVFYSDSEIKGSLPLSGVSVITYTLPITTKKIYNIEIS